MPLETTLQGPAILEQSDTTVIMEPKDNMYTDIFGNIIMNIDTEITK